MHIALTSSAWAQVEKTNLQGFGDRENSYAWSMGWLNGKLYVGTSRNVLCVERATLLFYFPNLAPILTPYSDPAVPCPSDPHDLDLRAEIWQYTPETNTWTRVFQSPADLPHPFVPGKFVARDIGFRDMAVFHETKGKQSVEALYVAGVSAREYIPGLPPPRILRSSDGLIWEPIPQDPGTVLGDLNAVTFRSMKVFDKRLFVTASPGLTGDGFILESARPYEGNDAFRVVSPTDMKVFEMEVFGGSLWVGTGDLNTGYGVYKTHAKGSPPYEFVPVVTNGAGRGKVITSVVSMHPFKGRLYVGSSGWNTGLLPSSELIRVKPNLEWEVVVGNPRSTETGVKSPISGLPDGFGNPFNFHFWRMQEHHGVLLLGTNDGSYGFRTVPFLDPVLHDEYGFDLFATNDGVFWTVLTRNGFGVPQDFGERTMASTKFGLFMGTANHELGTGVLLADVPRPLPSQVTRVTSELQDGTTLLTWSGTAGAVRVLRAEYTPKPSDQGPVPAQVIDPDVPPGELTELPEHLLLSKFVEVGRTDQSFFLDGSGVQNAPSAYYVEPVDEAGQPGHPSNVVLAPSLIPSVTLRDVARAVSEMTAKGSITNVDGWTPLATLVESITISLQLGNVAEANQTAADLYQEVKLNPGVITDPIDAEDLEHLVEKFLRRTNLGTLGVIPSDSLQ